MRTMNIEQFLMETMRDVGPGVRVDSYQDTDGLVVRYRIPARSLVRSRDSALATLRSASPGPALQRIEDGRARRSRMAIGKYRLGRFGRAS